MRWVVNATSRQLYPRENPVPIVEEVGWAPGPWVLKISPSPGFDPWTAQNLASRYIDRAIPANYGLWYRNLTL
jgi:hypothetical protein